MNSEWLLERTLKVNGKPWGRSLVYKFLFF
jgi:hypothetical protein